MSSRKGNESYWLSQQQNIPTMLRKFWKPELAKKKIEASKSAHLTSTIVKAKEEAPDCSKRSKLVDCGSLPQQRKEMIKLLEARLRPKIQDQDEVTKTAAIVERLLYKSAASTDSYDPKSVDKRLGVVMAAILRRKARKASPEAQREDTLKKALGDQQYKRGQAVLKNIAKIRLTRAFSTQPVSGSHALDEKLQRLPSLSSGEIPEQVRRVFFQNQLTQLWQSTPASQLALVDWDGVISQAEADLAVFRTWSSKPAV